MEFLINTMVFTIDDPSQPQESFIPDFKNAALAALSSLRPTVTRRNESWWRMEKPWKNGWKRCGLPCGYVKIAIENCHLQLICLSKTRDFPQLLWFTRGYQVHFAKRCLTIFPTHVGQNGLLGRFKGEKHMVLACLRVLVRVKWVWFNWILSSPILSHLRSPKAAYSRDVSIHQNDTRTALLFKLIHWY